MSGVLELVGWQVRRWRERTGLSQAELGTAIGYTEHQVSAVERGQRTPKAVFLEKADEAVGGRTPARSRGGARGGPVPEEGAGLEAAGAGCPEMCAYANQVIHGLLQTEEYARALHRMRRPSLDEEIIEQYVTARLSRQDVFERWPAPILSFVH